MIILLFFIYPGNILYDCHLNMSKNFQFQNLLLMGLRINPIELIYLIFYLIHWITKAVLIISTRRFVVILLVRSLIRLVKLEYISNLRFTCIEHIKLKPMCVLLPAFLVFRALRIQILLILGNISKDRHLRISKSFQFQSHLSNFLKMYYIELLWYFR